MAMIGPTALTLADWASRQDPEGAVADIVDLLCQTNEILDDMLFVEGNLPTGHKTTVRTGLPEVYWRMFNQGVPKSKSTTAPVTETCGMMQAFSEVDKDLCQLNSNSAEFRLSEDLAFIEAMNQNMARTLIYGNPTANPAAFMGLAPRYNTLNPAISQTAANVIDAGGTGSTNTSLYLVMWGPNATHGIFPQGMKAGLEHRDLGEEQALDANGNPYRALKGEYKWNAGLVVRDWRFVVRIANIDVNALTGSGAADLIKLMIRAIHRLPLQPPGAGNVTSAGKSKLTLGRAAFYGNRTLSTALDLQALGKNNVLLKMEEYAGKPVTTFRGLPVRTVDAIVNTEDRVVY